MTHFWMTGALGSPAAGPWLAHTLVRYYIDGELEPSIAFTPPLAAGVGFDDNFVFGTKEAGHGSEKGGWYVNYHFPFGTSVRVTLELPGTEQGCAWVIVRGCEGLPVQVGALTLPPTARMRLHKIEAVTFPALGWVPAVDVPAGDGLVFMHTISVNSTQASFWEGCYSHRWSSLLDAPYYISFVFFHTKYNRGRLNDSTAHS